MQGLPLITPPPAVWWLSFADPGKPDGEKFLGGCLVKAPSTMPDMAVREASLRNCNPGGEALIAEVTHIVFPEKVFERYGNRLLSWDECREMEAATMAELAALVEAPAAGGVQ